MQPFLSIELGEPFEKCEAIVVTNEMMIGRCWETISPDVSFASPYISKRHALISFTGINYVIKDLGSKHGTMVNGYDIGKEKSYILRHGDKIDLAKGTVLLVFNNPFEVSAGVTIDFQNSFATTEASNRVDLVVNPERREVIVDNQVVHIVGKDHELLAFLYERKGKGISYDEIKCRVWPERVFADSQSDVGNDEVTILVYRLRKKLGDYGKRVVLLPRFGYMLDLSK